MSFFPNSLGDLKVDTNQLVYTIPQQLYVFSPTQRYEERTNALHSLFKDPNYYCNHNESEDEAFRVIDGNNHVSSYFRTHHFIVMRDGTTHYVGTWETQSKQKKQLCVGGHLDGQMKTETQTQGMYEPYNCAIGYGRADKEHAPKTILVYRPLLGLAQLV